MRLPEGAIRAIRHVHMSPEQAAQWGLVSGQKVSIKTNGVLGITLDNVIVRTGENLILEMHIDTDEGNCAGMRASNNFGILH